MKRSQPGSFSNSRMNGASPGVSSRSRSRSVSRIFMFPLQGALARQGRILGEISLDAGDEGFHELLLVLRIAQLRLLVGVRDERRLDEDGRDVGRLQHREAGLLHLRLVQPA